MEGDQPYKPVLVISSTSGLQARGSGDYTYALRYNPAAPFDKGLLPSLINGGSAFLWLIDTPPDAPPLPDSVLLSFFSPRYLQIKGAPVVAFSDPHSGLETALTRWLQGQGYPGLHPWLVPEMLSSRQSPAEFLQSARSVGEPLIFQGRDLAESRTMEEHFREECKKLLKGNEGFRACIAQYMNERAAREKLEERYAILEERLRNAEATVEVARHKFKDDYDNLYHFYRNEYDILPLWYKRFGQAVKVVTGKRSFRSLFDDNVKKYKD